MRTPAFLVAALVATAMLASPALAGDAETIAACLKAEHKANHDGHACIGRVSDPCLQRPGGETTVGMVQCADRETKIWDDLLNGEYQRLLGVLDGKAAASVRTAQRAWITLRDADCQVPYDLFEGGTMAQPIAANCVLNHTAQRTLQLRDWRQMTSPEDE
jgi:uncharacterized protein YecT (DUF1311 family)